MRQPPSKKKLTQTALMCAGAFGKTNPSMTSNNRMKTLKMSESTNSPGLQPMPRYDHRKNSETIMMALKKGKFEFENQQVNFDMLSVYDNIVLDQI